MKFTYFPLLQKLQVWKWERKINYKLICLSFDNFSLPSVEFHKLLLKLFVQSQKCET